MWAGYIALVNQQLAANGQPPIGFLNPTIYAQNVTSSYAADFHDIVSGTSGSFSAVPGYDLVTGWGSPNAGLFSALTGSTTQTPAFTISASPTSLSVVQGNSGTSTITTGVSGGFNSAIALSTTGTLPSGVTVGFSPSSIGAPGSGTSTATFTVASNATPGTYPITIIGTGTGTGPGSGLTQSTTVSLTVTSSVQPAFTVSASPSSITVARNGSGNSTITTVSSGFTTGIALTASGQGSNLTVSFTPSTIATPGSNTSTMNVAVGRKAALGTHTITITAKGGGITHTTTVTVNVT